MKPSGFPTVPADVAAAVIAQWPTVGPQWCSQVGDELRDMCARYGARPIGLMPSRFGFVVPVVADGLSLIMRASPDPNGHHQARVAGVLAELGVAPEVHEIITTEIGTWVVLDRISPGTPLVDTGVSPETFTSLAAMLRPIREASNPNLNLPSLADWLRSRLEDDSLSELPPGFDRAPGTERARALSILRDLEPEAADGICHGDASPWNVLAGYGGRTFLIDPRGVHGDVAYDAAVIALKLRQYCSLKGVEAYLASLAGLDLQRVCAWLEVADAARV